MQTLEFLQQPLIRPITSLSILALLCLLEIAYPRRQLQFSKKRRWISNLSLSVFNVLALKLLIPISLTAIAVKVQDSGLGLLNILKMSYLIQTGFSLILLDLAIYFQHVLTHKISFLWKFHQVHHADVDLDVTSGNRFHPIEIIISFFYKALLVLIFGVTPISIIIFEIMLNSLAMFNHANLNIPISLDKILRILIVTPDMHRVHHSVSSDEHNKNFGFNLSCWDYLFRTYQSAPLLGHKEKVIGLDFFRDDKYIHPFELLKMPFLKRNDET